MRRFPLIVSIVLVVVVVGMLVFRQPRTEQPATEQTTKQSAATKTLETDAGNGFVTRQENSAVVLYRTNGTRREKTGLSLPIPTDGDITIPATVKVAPNSTMAAVAAWSLDRKKEVISVARLDGGAMREVAQQEVGEGQGSLVAETLAWSEDSAFLTYDEEMVTAGQGNEQTTIRTTTYRVEVATANKTVANTVVTTVDQ